MNVGFLFFVASNNDESPNNNFFPDVEDLFDDMTNDVSASSAAFLYVVILSSLLGLAFDLVLLGIDMGMMLVAYDLICMTSFNNLLSVSIIFSRTPIST